MFDINQINYKPLTIREWLDFTRLFEDHGIQNGCWCMYWRTSRVNYQKNYGEGNKQSLKALIENDKIPGILAYLNNRPVAWCSIALREDFLTLERSRTLRRVDTEPVWSITCFFVSKQYRLQGFAELLIEAAINYAKENGARIIESYPLRTEIAKLLPYERYMGIQFTYERVGFQIVASRSERHPVIRYFINDA